MRLKGGKAFHILFDVINEYYLLINNVTVDLNYFFIVRFVLTYN